MPTAIRKLGTILFVIGALAVIVGLSPVATGRVEGRSQQVCLAIAVVGALLAVSGLVTDWLGSHAVREHEAAAGASGDQQRGAFGESRPPSMRLSNRPTGRGFREDLMA